MNLHILKLLIVLILSFENAFSDEIDPVVQTRSGKIKGFHKYSPNNQLYKVFKNIPYAKPPVGDLRFAAPVPIDEWSHVLDGTNTTTKVCAQYDMLYHEAKGQEDCLYLHVYSPYKGEGPLLPVIFWIHGGAFQQGSSSEDGEKFYMDKNVVYVSFDYRVGPFGFLSTGDEFIPGNFGLKDQNLALKWVSKNIAYFGGDPKRITLQGCSAGGASVHYHYLSPLSRGLFQNGISMSGVALNAWAIAKNPMEDTSKVAGYVNCSTTDLKELVDCFRKVPMEAIANAASKILMSEYLAWDIDRPPFRPVAENVKDGYFINRLPQDIIESGDVYDVPWIVATDSEEGIMFTRGLLVNQTRLTLVDENWEKVGPYMMFMKDEIPEERHVEVAIKARKHYLGDKPLKVDDYYTLKQFIHLTGDKGFGFDAQRSAVLQAKMTKSPVHMYYYNYRATHSLGEVWIGTKDIDFGVCHCDEEVLISEDADDGIITEPKDMPVLEKMLNMIISYAETGEANLGVEWPRVNPSDEKMPYVHVAGPNDIRLEYIDDYAGKKFWNSVGL